MNIPVVWVYPFSVPNNKQEEFLTWWADVKSIIASEPGFAGGQLYRSDKSERSVQLYQCCAVGK
jgi:heme-degrading monooxygenase HmoA